MTSHTARLYALVGSVLVFFVAWAAIAAHPWQAQASTAQDPRLAALQLREQRLRAQSLAVKRIVDRRWAAYRSQLAARKREIAAVQAANARTRAQAAALASAAAAAPAAPAPSVAPAPTATPAPAPTPAPSPAPAAPSVRVVTLPPLTVTRTS